MTQQRYFNDYNAAKNSLEVQIKAYLIYTTNGYQKYKVTEPDEWFMMLNLAGFDETITTLLSPLFLDLGRVTIDYMDKKDSATIEAKAEFYSGLGGFAGNLLHSRPVIKHEELHWIMEKIIPLEQKQEHIVQGIEDRMYAVLKEHYHIQDSD